MPAIALVAAGARLGLSLGKTFGGHGFDVALIARSAERLDELTEKLAAEGVTAAGFPADVTDRSALTAALNSAAESFRRSLVLVSWAAIMVEHRPATESAIAITRMQIC